MLIGTHSLVGKELSVSGGRGQKNQRSGRAGRGLLTTRPLGATRGVTSLSAGAFSRREGSRNDRANSQKVTKSKGMVAIEKIRELDCAHVIL